MAHKIYIKKISRDYHVKPSNFERYVLWNMGLTDNWLILLGLFMLAITLTMFVILGLFVVFEGI